MVPTVGQCGDDDGDVYDDDDGDDAAVVYHDDYDHNQRSLPCLDSHCYEVR
jgi:hypothetical protein